MSIYDCDYHHTEAEFAELHEFLRETYALTRGPNNWFFSRLEDWRYGGNARRARLNPRFFEENVHLWREEGGRLIGFCICEYGDNGLMLQLHPDYHEAAEAMLIWAETVWAREKSVLEIFAEDYDRALRELLTARGYEDAGDDGYARRYDVSQLYPEPELPAGFRIVTLAEHPDIDGHVAAVRAAFGRETLDRAWYDSKSRAPGYAPEWDMAVLSPEGVQAAFCLTWPDRENGMAEIDPVGTVPDYQRRGLAKAVVMECFRRLHRAGIREAYIGSAPEPYISNRLYESLRPTGKYQTNKWVKRR